MARLIARHPDSLARKEMSRRVERTKRAIRKLIMAQTLLILLGAIWIMKLYKII